MNRKQNMGLSMEKRTFFKHRERQGSAFGTTDIKITKHSSKMIVSQAIGYQQTNYVNA